MDEDTDIVSAPENPIVSQSMDVKVDIRLRGEDMLPETIIHRVVIC
jgi:hypothetical protein